MSSLAARAVAKDVLKKVRRGEKVHIGKIVASHGYGKSMATHPNKVTNTKSYKDEIRPVIEAMERERNAIIKALPGKRGKAKYRDLIDGIDKMTKNIQLLSGRPTGEAGDVHISEQYIIAFTDPDMKKAISTVDELIRQKIMKK